ncbi:MAG: MOSC N-terminal beta barrel domain-containing protein [Bacteroidota bacterium]
MNVHLTGINIFPIKSVTGIKVNEAILEPKGLALDRRWMLVDEDGMFLTQRKDPKMSQIVLSFDQINDKIIISHRSKNMGQIAMSLTKELDTEIIKVQVWDDICDAQEVGGVYNEWFSQALERKCRLVFMPDTSNRPVNQKYAEPKDDVSFADGFPFLLANQASLDDLNGRMEAPVSMDRFRANFIIEGLSAWQEDHWSSFQIGDVPFRSVKPCARCTLLTVNPLTGEKGAEPLKTLSTFRQQGHKILFGINACWDFPDDKSTEAKVKIGDVLSFKSI